MMLIQHWDQGLALTSILHVKPLWLFRVGLNLHSLNKGLTLRRSGHGLHPAQLALETPLPTPCMAPHCLVHP